MSWSDIDFQNNAVALCVLFILFVISLKIITGLKNFTEPKEGELDNDTGFEGPCQFPDCVRCRRQKDVLMRARTRLTYCDSNHQCEGAASVAGQLLKDIQASYQKLTQLVGEDPRSHDVTKQNPLIFHLKGIRAQPVWETDDFPGVNALSEKLEEIQREFGDLMSSGGVASDAGYWKVNETPTGRWGICHLLDQGVLTKAAAVCPVTWQTVCSLRAAMTDNLFGNVAFSVIEPGTTIAMHFGPTNIRIRCHLGLQTPAGCQLTVADQSLQWSQGKLLCFDETYLHGVQSTGMAAGGEARVVLMVDLWHPDLDSEQRTMISYAFNSTAVP
ncbi:aspartate beta-hydroxylase domain-containing protein 2-like [Babylonia areolata]|uniref:aspartate beta-hydroxylase domain-containing protein 2-like n=1 Tax=Babylonia areolata TaxID=304850 RepID=UPI003FD55B3B